ncbi:hypothetical protein VTL71DRAFT_2004 [Oculimacula yallundae]|uniref:Uncharacterized protein n=1 Tax=Oculimacula yallundae TaxID=86028 RepID=A0ABR4CEK2_9HELO
MTTTTSRDNQANQAASPVNIDMNLDQAPNMRRFTSPASSSSSTISNGSGSTIDISLDDDRLRASKHEKRTGSKAKAQETLDLDVDFDLDAALLYQVDGYDTSDDELPPPSKLFVRKDGKGKAAGGGVKIKLNTNTHRAPRRSPTPSPPSRPPRLAKLANKFLNSSLPSSKFTSYNTGSTSFATHSKTASKQHIYQPTYHSKFRYHPQSQNRILCCDIAKSTPYNPRFSTLINNFISFGHETAYGRQVERTSVVEEEQGFVLVLQEGKAGGRNEREGVRMGRTRWFIPVMPAVKDGVETEDGGHTDMNGAKITKAGENIMKDYRVEGAREMLHASHSVIQHLARTERELTRSLVDMERYLNADPLSLSARQKLSVPFFTRSYPANSTAHDNLLREEIDKVEWRDGQLGFKEWFPTDTHGGSGKGMGVRGDEGGPSGLDVLTDYLLVEGRTGRMEVRCWDCEKEWILSVREKGMTI